MSDDRLITAIGRIERALSRVESRSVLPTAPPPNHVNQLEQRHNELRARTQSVIDQLDRLIAGAER